ncbi:MAG: peptidoglycan DD-metalloendopeptidase family protein [Clostridia bacterium]|nr:peptidoglycan DD-metalloendopeptidase family protein [Clostridia bacterium]
MNKKIVRTVALLIAFALIASVLAVGVSYVFAANEQAQIDASEKKVQEQQKKIKDINNKQALTAENIEALKKETVGIQSQIDAKNAELAETQAKLDATLAQLAQAKKESKEQYEAYKERFRVMCEDGTTSTLALIFSSKSLMDLVNNLEVAKEISNYDKKIHDEMKQKEKEISDISTEIEAIKKTQEGEKAILAQQKASLDSKQAELEKVKKTLMSDAAAAQRIIDEEIRKQNALKAQMSGSLSKGNGTVSNGYFLWPTPSCTYITSHFAPQRVNPVTGKLRPHTGTDIGAQYGANIIAAAGGTVKFAGWNGGYGNCAIIDHGGGVSTLYAHMSSLLVSAGQYVSAGSLVGRVGSTGNSTGPHLHFEVLINGTAVNPMQYF